MKGIDKDVERLSGKGGKNCVICEIPIRIRVNNQKYCSLCAAAARKEYQTEYSKNPPPPVKKKAVARLKNLAAKRKKRKEAGLCPRCAAEREHHVYCPKCREYFRLKRAGYRQSKRKATQPNPCCVEA